MREHWFSQARRVYASRFQFFTDGNVRSISPKRFQIHGPSEVSAFCCCVHFCPDSSQKYSSQGAVLLEMLILEDNYWKYVGKREASSICSLIKHSGWPGLGQAEARSLELHPGLPCGWQGHSYLNHHLLPPRACISRKLESIADLGLEPRHSVMQGIKSKSVLENIICQIYLIKNLKTYIVKNFTAGDLKVVERRGGGLILKRMSLDHLQIPI
nr:uncharacterized protein LOC127483186 isoform X1 [Oryctolagus cuniculus]